MQLPWKPVKSIVAYYYMWKTTDRYQIQKRHRMIEKQNDLKEVIVHLRTSSDHKDLSGEHERVKWEGRGSHSCTTFQGKQLLLVPFQSPSLIRVSLLHWQWMARRRVRAVVRPLPLVGTSGARSMTTADCATTATLIGGSMGD